MQAYAAQRGQIGIRMCIREERKAKYQVLGVVPAPRHAIFNQRLDKGMKCLPSGPSIFSVRKFEPFWIFVAKFMKNCHRARCIRSCKWQPGMRGIILLRPLDSLHKGKPVHPTLGPITL